MADWRNRPFGSPDEELGDIQHMEDRYLLDFWAYVEAQETRYREQRERIEEKLRRRMEERDAREIYHPDLRCELVRPTPAYDLGKLHRLAEMIDPEVLRAAYTPARQETVTVPEKWDARVFKSWASRYGSDVAQVIKEAELPGGPNRVRVSRKQGEH